jgi:hypothetical protein
MNWMAKTRGIATATAAPPEKSRPGQPIHADSTASVRTSNGLKEFLWLISETPHARVLDLGPVWQSTVTFFAEKGYRVSTEDLLRTWRDFLTAEEERLRTSSIGEPVEKVSQPKLAEHFLETNLQYAENAFHGVLAWDLLDYFDASVAPLMLARLFDVLRPGGVVLTLFHSRAPGRFHRYRVVDSQKIESLPASTLAVHTRIFQNREILDLFGKFRSSKTFVGRDQLREALFIK